MNIFLLLIKIIILFVIILILTNQIGNKHPIDFNIIDIILLLLLSNIIINSKSYLENAIAMLLLISYKLFIKYLIPILPTIKYMFFNKKSLVIRDGKLNFKEIVKRQYRLNDLLNELNNRNVKRIEDVDYAILEYNNNLVIRNDKEIPIPIILNGRVDYLSLKLIHKNTNWINKIIKKENILLEDIFYAFYKQKKVYIIQNK
jgi:uncharacterized membrane protein YcaP (DUF421 family)